MTTARCFASLGKRNTAQTTKTHFLELAVTAEQEHPALRAAAINDKIQTLAVCMAPGRRDPLNGRCV